MFENIAAIDIGSSIVKMIKVKMGLKGFQVKSMSYESIDRSIENKTEACMQAIKKMLADDPIAGYKVISDLPMENVLIRSITFPFNDPKKIAEAMPFEAEENVPFDINRLDMSFKYLGGGNENEGRILLAAAQKDYVYDFMNMLNGAGLSPAALGLEADSLFACYSSLCTVKDETVILVHIGAGKTIINIIENDKLLYTRTCQPTADSIIGRIGEYMKLSHLDSLKLINSLNIDITSLDNTLRRGGWKEAGIEKNKMKKIFTLLIESFEAISEQIRLTVKACALETKITGFNRVVVSGGGVNLPGIETFIGDALELPAAALPFLPEYTEPKINLLFHHALGMIYSYTNKKNGRINFLKDEFIPDIGSGESGGKKIYYLAGFFLVLAAFLLIVNLLISLISGSALSFKYNEILADRYRKYFNEKTVPEDPIAAAREKLRRETRELEAINSVLGEDVSVLEMLGDILTHFEPDPSFELKNLVTNESVIRIEGLTASSSGIDNFKEELQKTGKFDSVSLNISSSRKGNANFTLTIKKKKDKK